MDGSEPGGVSDSAAYALTQLDVDHLFQFLWFMSVAEIFQFVMLVLIAGLIFGIILTNRWHV